MNYTIIGGVNGVGKSTLTGVLKKERSDLGTIIDVYAITAKEANGNPIQGGRIAVGRIASLLNQKKPFTQETTLNNTFYIKDDSRQWMDDMLKDLDCDVVLFKER